MGSDLLAELGIVCPRCEALNEPRALLCCACSAALRSDAAGAAAWREPLVDGLGEKASPTPDAAPTRLDQAAQVEPAATTPPGAALASAQAGIAAAITETALALPAQAVARPPAAASAGHPRTSPAPVTAPGCLPGLRSTPPPLPGSKASTRPGFPSPGRPLPPPPPPRASPSAAVPPAIMPPPPAPKPSAPPPGARGRAAPPVLAPARPPAPPRAAPPVLSPRPPAPRPIPTPAPAAAQAPRIPPAPTPVATAAPVVREVADRARLLVVRGAHAGAVFRIGAAPTAAGRSEGAVLLPDDPYVSPIHATFSWRDGKLHVRDECSDSGTYVPLRDSQPLSPGTTFVVGDHLLRYAGRLASPTAAIPLAYGAPLPAGFVVRIEELLEGNRSGRIWLRPSGSISIGRSGCAIELSDPSVAARQCELLVQPDRVILHDLGSPEGTLIRMGPGTECTLSAGESLRIGGLLLRVEL